MKAEQPADRSGKRPGRAAGNTLPETTDGAPAGEPEVVFGGLVKEFIGPGGKVDAEAIRRTLDETARRAEEGGEDADEAELRTVSFTLQRDLDKRLDKYLTDRITFMSRNQLQKLIDEGGVTVNGKLPKASTRLNAGDTVAVVVPPPPLAGTAPEDIPLDVLFEDEHIIVLNKQPDIIVHPARSHLKGTLINALAYHFANRSAVGGALSSVGDEFARPGVVHRLDRHTSGCIVFAKRDEAHWKLGRQFEQRRVDKRYLAVVRGRVEPAVDVVELPIGPHPSREKGYREKYVVRHDEAGKHAVTIYRVRERYEVGVRGGMRGGVEAAAGMRAVAPGWKAVETTVGVAGAKGGGEGGVVPGERVGPYALVELELKTGRTHQIRVHLSHLGWPIVGDDMYGGRPFVDEDGATIIARQALHACVLGFTHPISGAKLEFTAPLRGDIALLVAALRRQSGGGERLEAPGATVDLEQALSRLPRS